MPKRLKSLRQTGGALAVAAGILAILAAQLMFVLDGITGVREPENYAVFVAIELGAVLLSFLTAASGALSMSVKSRMPGILLIVAAILAAHLGGLLVALFMAVALAGGVLVLIGDNRQEQGAPVQEA